MGLLGGMRMPSVPPVAEIPEAYSGEYPLRIMDGIMRLPMAATVPGPEPIMAAKNMDPRIVTMPRPPLMCPTSMDATSTICAAIPPLSMSAPANMKPTTARSGNMSETLSRSIITRLRGMSLNSRTMTEAIPSETKIGAPMARSTPMATHMRISSSIRTPPRKAPRPCCVRWRCATSAPADGWIAT